MLGGVVSFLRKYFCDGQRLVEEAEWEAAGPSESWRSWLKRHRRLVSVATPALLCHLIWWPLAVRHGYLGLLPSRWAMGLTMVFGALVAGATSEGGGSVAFPVMTLALRVPPSVARDFSLLIQSCGMTAASLAILHMGLRLEWASVLFSSLGAVGGVVVGLEVLDDLVSPAAKKMGFVAVFFSFAVALFLLNRRRGRRVVDAVQGFGAWQAAVLVAGGFVGGVLTGLVGSGVDMVSFSLLTLLFSVSEKVATPTSVVLMSVNTAVGAYWRAGVQGAVSREAYEYLAVCAPIVVVCAPLGSLAASHFHRLTLAALVYVLETVALVSAFLIVRPGPGLTLATLGVLAAASGLFCLLSIVGTRILPQETQAPPPSPPSPIPAIANSHKDSPC